MCGLGYFNLGVLDVSFGSWRVVKGVCLRVMSDDMCGEMKVDVCVLVL